MSVKYSNQLLVGPGYNKNITPSEVVETDSQVVANSKFQAQINAGISGVNISIANIAYVAKNGNDSTGNGSINKPYLTIQKAIDLSPANTQIYVFASGLATATAYIENLTLKDSQVITGSNSQFVVIAGTVTTPATGGLNYLENLRVQPASNAGNVSCINIAGGANVTNLQLNNVDVNLYGGTGSSFSWTNTNANSRLISDGISAFNVISSANGAKIFSSSTGSAGMVIFTWASSQINDNINNVAYSINGAIRFYHTFDNIYGQIVVANTASFTGTFLTNYTSNVAALVTNSSTLSSLNSCLMTTTANSTPTTAVVEGAGRFAFFQTATPNTTTKGFATTLNGGIGAIAGATYSIRLDSSAIASFVAGSSDGLIQYDGNNYYVDTSSVRSRIATSDRTTGIIPTAQLPIATTISAGTNFANQATIQYATSSTINVSELPLNSIGAFYNSSSGPITLTLPSNSNYRFVSTVLGNSANAITLQSKDIFSFIYNGANVFIIGYTATGSNINVLNPTTSTTTSLNTALANISSSSGGSKGYATGWKFGGGSYLIGTTQIIPVVNNNFVSANGVSTLSTINLWSQSNITSGSFESIAYGNGTWVAGSGTTGIYYSTNGITWTQSNITSGGFEFAYYANNLWLALGNSSNGIFYSIDGISWTRSDLGVGYSLTSVYYANGLWVCTSLTNGLYYSTNGINWNGVLAISGNFYSIAYGNGTWVAGSGTTGMWYSTNGTSWNVSNINTGTCTNTYFGNNLFVGSSNNSIYYSTNGITWTQGNITPSSFFKIYYANNLWVTSSSEKGIYYSTNGITWTQSNITSGGFFSILYNSTRNKWIMGGANNNGIYYSTDGITWTQSNNIKNNNIFSLADNVDQIIIGTNNGIYYPSENIILKNRATYRIKSNISISSGICSIRCIGVNGVLNGNSVNGTNNTTKTSTNTIINNSTIFTAGNTEESTIFLEITIPNNSLLPAIIDSNNTIFEIEEI